MWIDISQKRAPFYVHFTIRNNKQQTGRRIRVNSIKKDFKLDKSIECHRKCGGKRVRVAVQAVHATKKFQFPDSKWRVSTDEIMTMMPRHWKGDRKWTIDFETTHIHIHTLTSTQSMSCNHFPIVRMGNQKKMLAFILHLQWQSKETKIVRFFFSIHNGIVRKTTTTKTTLTKLVGWLDKKFIASSYCYSHPVAALHRYGEPEWNQ